MCCRYPCLASEQDKACLLGFALKVLLYQFPSKGRTNMATPLSVGLHQMVANPPRGVASQAMHEFLLAALSGVREGAEDEVMHHQLSAPRDRQMFEACRSS